MYNGNSSYSGYRTAYDQNGYGGWHIIVVKIVDMEQDQITLIQAVQQIMLSQK